MDSKNGYKSIVIIDDHAIVTSKRGGDDSTNNDFTSYSYPVITSSVIRSENDEDELVTSVEKQIRSRISPVLPVTPSVDDSKSLANIIPFFGLICSMLSVVCYSLASLIVKILTDLHAVEILGIRSCFQIIFYLGTTIYYGLPFFGSKGQRLDISLRAIFGSIAAITIYMSYRLIPLADASTIQFSAPVFVFFLAYFILGERISLIHIFTGLLALVGVVFVSKPKFILQQFDPSMINNVNYNGVLLALVAAISTAFGMIMLRKLKNTPVQVVVLWFSISTTISAFITLHFLDRFVWPSGGWVEWAWLVGIGFAGIGDQLFMTLAFKYESAGVVSVSRTMTIVLAFIWDTLILDVTVHWTSVLGSCLVTFAVILLAIDKSMENEQNIFKRTWNKISGKIDNKATNEERTKLVTE
ncbi:hypothetical protein RDWZM_003256 [Blomia tropicalis]|uniref:EamA domain-containing protein n=1 Tax=Blomia tropicalis TaxID=40697 RepID=A0A9Q0RSW0_BLOTA|nr:hypothetical protein RDWZM_003256 [Blomia tropicalis]